MAGILYTLHELAFFYDPPSLILRYCPIYHEELWTKRCTQVIYTFPSMKQYSRDRLIRKVEEDANDQNIQGPLSTLNY